MDRVLIVGCGDIGRRVARLWRARGVPVSGLARSPAAAERLSRVGIAPVRGDLDLPASLRGLPLRGALVYHFAPPPAEGETDPRTRALADAIPDEGQPRALVYMSTTAVYGDLSGGWASEETPPAPATGRGRRRLDAEDVLLAWGRGRGVPVVVLRVAGIYGPGRLPVEAIRRGTPVLAGADSPYTNRIHADDLARVCVAAAERGRAGRIYNVSDGVPGTITEYVFAVADRLGLPRPPAVGLREAGAVLSPGLLEYLSESRRLDSRRMREELGIALAYPTLAAGLAATVPAGLAATLPRGSPQQAPRGSPQQAPRGSPQQTPRGSPQHSRTTTEEAGMGEQKTVALVITGMTCGHCAMAVRKSVSAVPGVSAVDVTLDPPRAVVTFDPATAGAGALAAAVRDAGYDVEAAPGDA